MCLVLYFSKSADYSTIAALELKSQGADPHSPSSTQGKAGRNHLNEEIIPLLPTAIGELYSLTIAPMWTPSINESAELTQSAL
jgi:hypothetical protein